jgi:hypothetical protein
VFCTWDVSNPRVSQLETGVLVLGLSVSSLRVSQLEPGVLVLGLSVTIQWNINYIIKNKLMFY